MRSSRPFLATIALVAFAAMALTACSSGEPTAVEPAAEEIETQVEEQQSTVDETLNSAQATVGELAAALGGLEARINGLQVNSDLQEIQRKLNNAIEETGDRKIAALEELSAAFDNVIAKIDAAATKLPEGGELRVKLEDFSGQLKDVQTSLAEAADSYETTPTP
jgi:chromosome segregation ATPase